MYKHTVVLLTILFACGCTQEQGAAGRSTMPPQQQGAVIVRLVGRDTSMTVRAGANGPIYSFDGKSGSQVVPGMTLDQLQANHPDLARRVQTLQASQTGAWAGVD